MAALPKTRNSRIHSPSCADWLGSKPYLTKPMRRRVIMSKLSIRLFAVAVCLSAAAVSPAWDQEKSEQSARVFEIKVAHARITFLSSTASDIGPDLMSGTADDDTAGPFFVVKGDIVSVNGAPATGAFICR